MLWEVVVDEGETFGTLVVDAPDPSQAKETLREWYDSNGWFSAHRPRIISVYEAKIIGREQQMKKYKDYVEANFPNTQVAIGGGAITVKTEHGINSLFFAENYGGTGKPAAMLLTSALRIGTNEISDYIEDLQILEEIALMLESWNT